MPSEKPTIIYTLTDEAPALATSAFLPIIRTFTDAAGVNVETADISVAARVLAEFPDFLRDDQKVPDTLSELGKLTQDPDTNIIKLDCSVSELCCGAECKQLFESECRTA